MGLRDVPRAMRLEHDRAILGPGTPRSKYVKVRMEDTGVGRVLGITEKSKTKHNKKIQVR